MPKKVQNIKLLRSSAPRGNAAPLAVGGRHAASFEVQSLRDPKFPDAIRIRGKDYMGPVQVPTGGDQTGGAYLNLFLSPEEFSGTRFEKFGQLYEKFRFKRLKFHFQPSQPATQKGSIILAYDRDVSDPTPSAGLAGVREYLSWQGSVSGSIWEELSIDCPLESPDSGYYTNAANSGDERLAFQGQAYIACLQPSGLAANTMIGDLWVEYELELFVPQLANVPSSYSSITTTQPTAADCLSCQRQAVFSSATSASNMAFNPKNVPGFANAVIELGEGLYRLTDAFTQGAAGGITIAPPTLALKDPGAATQAPVGGLSTANPWVKVLNNVPSTAVGQISLLDVLVDVPRGGGWLSQALTTATGVGGAGNNFLDIQKIGSFINRLDSIF